MQTREFDVACIVMKLVGPIDPIGETIADEKRYKNLLHLIDVVDDLIGEIMSIEKYSSSHEYSVSNIGIRARSFLNELRQSGD